MPMTTLETRDPAEPVEQRSQAPSGQPARASAPPLPDDALIIIPVRNMVLFPGMVVPITMARERSVAAAQEAARSQLPVGIILQRDPEVVEPGPTDLHDVGTSAAVLRYLTGPDGTHHLVCQGQQRFRVREFIDGHPFLVARVEPLEDKDVAGAEVEARMLQLRQRAIEALGLIPNAPAELVSAVQTSTSAGALADLVAGTMDLKPAEKQEVLQTLDVQSRLDRVLWLLAYRIEVLRLSRDIGQQTEHAMGAKQREYLLREQLKPSRRSSAKATTASRARAAELAKAIAEAKMPQEVEQQARKELARLERMPEASAEYSMIRAYLDWLIALPWSDPAEESIDIAHARRILDEDHFGLERIKRRILEYLAVRKLRPDGKSPILCFVGPPGVGKTSLGQSIARATGRKFARDQPRRRARRGRDPRPPTHLHRRAAGQHRPGVAQGGDEQPRLHARRDGQARGRRLSRRSVVGPARGARSGAERDLPRQLPGLPFDLSKVMFIGTANMLDTIPGPLRDRMEIIQLSGYTEEEKLQIARRYLVKRQLDANGLTAEQCEITDEALRVIIRDYTREAGVRNLEREIGAVLRSVAMRIAEGAVARARLDADDIAGILGARKFESEVATRTSVPGVATGLAWTPVGGDILFIEATRVPGSGKTVLTGQLGDVMKESAQIALSLAKSRARELGVKDELFARSDIHIHVPAGAIPKDGPSAGVAMFTALASLLTGRTVHSNVAMTGEISLRGLVLPVGGIKEKVVAAVRAGITTVMLPARNRRDLEDIPEEARRRVKFVWLERVEDAVHAAIGPDIMAEGKAPELLPAD